MMCGNAREQMAAAWAGELDEAAESQLKRHLAECAECAAEMRQLTAMWERLADLPAPEPSMAQHIRWEAALAELTHPAPSRDWRRSSNNWKFSLDSLWPRRPVWQATIAAGCLIAGLLGGAWIQGSVQQASRDSREIAALRNEVAATREMVALSMLGQQSATERLRGVDYSERMPTLEPRVVSALIQAVNGDSNVNVRLAAIDALVRVEGDAQVRSSLAASLGRQESPMVQAALIDYLVDSRDVSAASQLREFSAKPDLNDAVKQHAEIAARRLTEYK